MLQRIKKKVVEQIDAGIKTQLGHQDDPSGNAAQSNFGDQLATRRPPFADLLGLRPGFYLQMDSGSRCGAPRPIVVRAKYYNYVPSVMVEDGLYRMYWGGGLAGDHIFYAQAPDPKGPWRAPDGSTSFPHVLAPRRSKRSDCFDDEHTCDPNILKVKGTYYLYYGGKGLKKPWNTTYVGVAASTDGLTFQRLNGGSPIVGPARPSLPPTYGAGQPAAFYVAPNFYLAYTDHTGHASNPVNHAGIYVLRSADPTFQINVDELTAKGFAPRTPQNHTRHAIIEAFSIDWTYLAAQKLVVLGTTLTSGKGVALHVMDLDGKKMGRDAYLTTPTQEKFAEGPGFFRSPEGHALVTGREMLQLDVAHAMVDHSGRSGPDSWDIGHYGARFKVLPDVAPVMMQSEGLPLALVTQAGRIQTDSHQLAELFAHRCVKVAQKTFYAIPLVGTLRRGGTVVTAPGRDLAFVDADNPQLLFSFDTTSPLRLTPAPQQRGTSSYDSCRIGARLCCLR